VDRARRLRLYLRLVEATSIPLAALVALYVLTGYGMVSEALRPLGLSYAVSARIHTSRELRVLLVALAALHGYPGLALLAHRRVRGEGLRVALEALALALTVAFVALCAYAELSSSYRLGGGRRGWARG